MVLGHSSSKIKEAVRFKQARRRRQARRFLLEGPKMIADVAARGVDIEALFVTAGRGGTFAGNADLRHVRVFEVTDKAMQRLSSVPQPQGAVAVAHTPQRGEVRLGMARLLVLDALQQPGNVGAIIRTAEYFGFDGALLLGECADPLHPKTLRASAGTSAFFPIKHLELPEFLEELDEARTRLIATSPRRGTSLQRFSPSTPTAILIGGEGSGLSPVLFDKAAEVVRIPRKGTGESLNAAAAAAVVMYACCPQVGRRDAPA